jgi:hypothetical protein
MVAMIPGARRVHLGLFDPGAGAGDPPAAEREQVQASYEHAAGLLASAAGLRAAAHEPGAAAALGPTLACLEASLDALTDVGEQLWNHFVGRRSETEAVRHATGLADAEAEERFREFVHALERSRAACAYARLAVGPVQSCARNTRW